jgi:flagellar basal-body rod protein FlgB
MAKFEPAEPMAATNQTHFDYGDDKLDDDGMRYRVPFNASADGNTVEITVEQAKYGKAAADYQATLTFLENRVNSIRKALRGD